MSRPRSEAPLPPCYALVHQGLEPVAADEIERDLGGEVKRTGRGLVVFRVDAIDDSLLELRTTEDVFLFAWGTDQLTHRAEDLDKIQRWTAREPDWERLLRLHHAVRPKPKGRPTYRLITQMEGQHGYLRRDARQALARGMAGKLPASWKPAEENAAVEIWLTIDGPTAVCGLRLSDRTMRHRTYKLEHRPASLRPTLAAAMVRLAEIKPPNVVLDPMCGAGTLLAEHLAVMRTMRVPFPPALGGDMDVGGGSRGRGQPAPPGTSPPGAVGRRPAAAGDAFGGPHRVQPAVRQAARRTRNDRAALPPDVARVRPRVAAGRPGRPPGRRLRQGADGGAGGRLAVAAFRDGSHPGSGGDDRGLAEGQGVR